MIFRARKAHFIPGMQYPLAEDAQATPPVQCHVAVGDLVTFQNDYGWQFFDLTVTGFSPDVAGDRFVYFDHEAWWFAVAPTSLIKQTYRVGMGPRHVSTEMDAESVGSAVEAEISRVERLRG